jgi:hypothetical protein
VILEEVLEFDDMLVAQRFVDHYFGLHLLLRLPLRQRLLLDHLGCVPPPRLLRREFKTLRKSALNYPITTFPNILPRWYLLTCPLSRC